MSRGWVKIHREMSSNWVWDCEFSTGQAWVDLLMSACHKPNKLQIKGQIIDLKIGELARSEVTLARDWKWSRNKVRRFLKNLENDGMIEQKKGHLTSVITICNYSTFQTGDTTDDTANDTANDTAKGHLAEHKQECLINKELNNTDNTITPNGDVTPPPEKPKKPTVDYSVLQMTDEQVEEVKRIRKQTKGVNSQRAINQLAKECDLSRRRGFSNDDILNEWTTRGWRSYKDEWNRSKQSVKVKATPIQPTKNTSLDDEIRELMESGL